MPQNAYTDSLGVDWLKLLFTNSDIEYCLSNVNTKSARFNELLGSLSRPEHSNPFNNAISNVQSS